MLFRWFSLVCDRRGVKGPMFLQLSWYMDPRSGFQANFSLVLNHCWAPVRKNPFLVFWLRRCAPFGQFLPDTTLLLARLLICLLPSFMPGRSICAMTLFGSPSNSLMTALLTSSSLVQSPSLSIVVVSPILCPWTASSQHLLLLRIQARHYLPQLLRPRIRQLLLRRLSTLRLRRLLVLMLHHCLMKIISLRFKQKLLLVEFLDHL